MQNITLRYRVHNESSNKYSKIHTKEQFYQPDVHWILVWNKQLFPLHP